jgi:hypothetical protein
MTIAAAFAALILTIAATSGEAQMRARIGATTVSNANSAYTVDHGYDECRFVDRIDRKGNIVTIKICDVVPY